VLLFLYEIFGMQIEITLGQSELTTTRIKRLFGLVKKLDNADITIHISPANVVKALRMETREEYFNRLDKAIKDIDDGNMVSLPVSSLKSYLHALVKRK
jgi:hypothetical protein